MKKLSFAVLALAFLGLGGCSSTSDVAKSDKAEKTSSTETKGSSLGTCDRKTGSRLSKKC